MKINKIVMIAISFAFALGCRTESDGHTRVNFQIVNGTPLKGVLLFFEPRSDGVEVLSFQATIQGEGLIIERDFVFSLGGISPTEAFESSLAKVIFNDERVEKHQDIRVPQGRSIFDQGSYKKVGANMVYTITQENLDHAVPCDGPCE